MQWITLIFIWNSEISISKDQVSQALEERSSIARGEALS